MNYIYDILINFQRKYYDSFEWYKNDNILHVKKIPVFKIKDYELKDIFMYKVKINKIFLEEIKNKTFSSSSSSLLKYSFILTDGLVALTVSCDSNGDINYYSSLLNDEEIDILDFAKDIDLINFSYQTLKKLSLSFETRKDIVIKKKLKKSIKNMIENKELDKLKYIYLECFNDDASIDYILNNIFKNIADNYCNEKMSYFVDLVSKH